MGADIYLRSVYDKNKAEHEPLFHAACKKRDELNEANADHKQVEEVHQAEVEKHYEGMYAHPGYYRDSYNNTSLAHLLGFSYWRDIVPLLNEEGDLPLEKIQTFREFLSKEITLEMVEGLFSQSNAEEAKTFFDDKKRRLLEMLKLSEELKEPLHCSL